MERVKPFDVAITKDPSGAQYQLGKIAYEAYCDALPHGIGKTLPTYDKQFDGVNALTDHVRHAWQMAASAVFTHRQKGGTA